MPESNPRRPTLLAADSRCGIADPIQKDFLQRLEHRANRRGPDPRPRAAQRRRASRSRLAPRFAPARRAMASNLRPGRRRATPSRESSDKPGRPVSFLRMLSARRAGRRRVPLRSRRAGIFTSSSAGCRSVELRERPTNSPPKFRGPPLIRISRGPIAIKTTRSIFASDRLSSIGINANGGGTFKRLAPELLLSQTDPYVNCSTWKLPRWFEPRGRPPLSYHSKASRWTSCATSMRVQSAYPGQEFVLDLEQYPEARGWLRSIFRDANR